MESDSTSGESEMTRTKTKNPKIEKMKKMRWYTPLAILVILSLLLAACGDSTTTATPPTPVASSGGFDTGSNGGDFETENSAACDGKGQVSGQILAVMDEAKGLQPVPATLTLTTAGKDPVTVKADAEGNYSLDNLDINEYEVEASLPGGLDGKNFQTKKKYVTVDDCQIETASMVLVADGIKVPETPPAPPQQQIVYVNNQPHYSIASNPFFWLWLLDRPGYYGYSHPPMYTNRIYNTGGVLYVPQAPRPVSNPNYSYTSYKPGDTTATKVKSEPPIVSKGSTRIGSSGYVKPVVSSGSKGGSRPGSSSGSSSSSGSPSKTQAPSNSTGGGSSKVSPPSSSGGGSSKVSPPSSSGGSKGGTRPGGGKKR